MGFYAWKPYVPVAKRREQAARKLAKLQKKGQKVAPVAASRIIASSFWGKSWCDNLGRYSDFANRLPRGRTYVRNGSVVDLQIAKGEVTAKVAGSELYSISITIAPVAEARWKALAKDCSGSIDSVVELLQGKLAKGVMDRVCRQGDGLFPAPKEIALSCSCPDWADMCKHVAAALYGVGARLDTQPELLFLLRGVDQNDLIASAGANMATPRRTAEKGKVLDDDNMAALFGLDMVEDETLPTRPETENAPLQPTRAKRSKTSQARNPAEARKTAAGKSGSLKATAKSSPRKPARKGAAPKASTARLPRARTKSLARSRS